MSDVKTNHESETLRCYKSALCVFSHSGHIFQNNGIMVKSTIATELMAILYRSHSTDGCVVTSIFTWGAACCRGHQQVVIYPFGAGLSNVTFHYLPCLVSSRCSDLFFFSLLKYSIISPLWCAFAANVAIQPVVDVIQPLQPFVSRFQQADLKMLSPSEVLLMCSHSFLQLTGLYSLQLLCTRRGSNSASLSGSDSKSIPQTHLPDSLFLITIRQFDYKMDSPNDGCLPANVPVRAGNHTSRCQIYIGVCLVVNNNLSR